MEMPHCRLILMETDLCVLFEDNHCLAVAKAAPLLTQGPPGVPSLEAFAKAYLKKRYHKKGNVYLGIPHRLDRPVTGVVLFARNTKAAQRLAEQFQGRQVRKIYWALVERSDFFVNLKVDPRLDPVRSDARFADLLARTGLRSP